MNGMLLFKLINVSIINLMALSAHMGQTRIYILCLCTDLLRRCFNCCKNMLFTCIENTECENILVQGKRFTILQ